MQSYTDWQLDSLVCFNQSADRCVMVIMNSKSSTVNNSLNYFYGVMIKDKWYFFSGSTLYLLDNYLGLSKDAILNFSQLREFSMKYVFSGYLIKHRGKYVINDKFFDDLTSVAWGPSDNTSSQWDSTYLSIVRKNWENDEHNISEKPGQ